MYTAYRGLQLEYPRLFSLSSRNSIVRERTRRCAQSVPQRIAKRRRLAFGCSRSKVSPKVCGGHLVSPTPCQVRIYIYIHTPYMQICTFLAYPKSSQTQSTTEITIFRVLAYTYIIALYIVCSSFIPRSRRYYNYPINCGIICSISQQYKRIITVDIIYSRVPQLSIFQVRSSSVHTLINYLQLWIRDI